jgi:hypothetical protein
MLELERLYLRAAPAIHFTKNFVYFMGLTRRLVKTMKSTPTLATIALGLPIKLQGGATARRAPLIKEIR